MYEKAIRDIIARCMSQYGCAPTKIAMTRTFFHLICSDVLDQYVVKPNETPTKDLVFGENTRVYAVTPGGGYKESHGVIAWEVSPNRAYQQ